ncbi:hypothetical protein BH23PAT1_BH23PAT1_0490 [soil metagenome]
MLHNNHMPIRSYYPSGINGLRSENIGIVSFNPVGSSVLEDAGRDARYTADELGIIVIAADRPGSGFTLPDRRLKNRLTADYVKEMSDFALLIEREISLNGLSKVILEGRSAGGTAALATGCTERLPVAAIQAKEAVGWRQMDVRQGKAMYREYLGRQALLLAEDSGKLTHPQPTDQRGLAWFRRATSVGINYCSDQFHNSKVWCQPAALQSSIYLATRLPDIYTQIYFAKNSMVLGPVEIDVLDASLPVMRQSADAMAHPFEIVTAPATVHSSFDNRPFAASLLNRFLETTLNSGWNQPL